MFFLIMAPGYIIILLTVFLLMRNITLPRNGLLLGVKIPADKMKDENILRIVQEFREKAKRLMFLSIISSMIGILLKNYPIISSLYFMIWMFLVFGLMQVVIIRGFDELYQYKKENHWIVCSTKVMETNEMFDQLRRKVCFSSWHWLLITLLTAAAVMIWLKQSSNLVLDYVFAGSNVLTTVILILSFIGTKRMKSTIYSKNAEVNVLLNQNSSYELTKMFAVSGYMNSCCYLLGSLFAGIENQLAVILGTTTAATCGVLICVWVGYRRIDSRRQVIMSREDAEELVDDDVYWRGGFYNNPNDPKLLVEKRLGMGLQFNDAHPAAKAFYGVCAVLVVGLCVWLATEIPLDFPSLHVSVEEGIISVKAASYSSKISLDEVERAEIVEKLPTMYRNNGYSDKGYDFGQFRVKEIGQCKVYINKKIPQYIILHTKDTIYVLNCDKKEEYDQMVHEIEKIVPIQTHMTE